MQEINEEGRDTSTHQVHEPFRHTNKDAVDFGQQLCEVIQDVFTIRWLLALVRHINPTHPTVHHQGRR